MKLKEVLDNNTGKAWESLYQRLENDGLVEATTPDRRLHPNIWGWAASVAVIIVAAISLFFIPTDHTSKPETLVLYNEANNPTLVTTLEDGSVVFLSEETSIEYPSHFAGNQRKISLNGDAFFEVTSDKENPFIIDTREVLIEVLGTSFSVNSKAESDFSLSVRSGEVRITSKASGESTSVKAGETALMYPGKFEKVATKDLAYFKTYLNRIYFKDQPLHNVLRIINEKNSNSGPITCSPQVAGIRLTVTLSDESPEDIVQIICAGLNLQYAQKQNAIHITNSE